MRSLFLREVFMDVAVVGSGKVSNFTSQWRQRNCIKKCAAWAEFLLNQLLSRRFVVVTIVKALKGSLAHPHLII